MMCFDQNNADMIRECIVQDFSLNNKAFKSICENCKKGFPGRASLSRHHRHCQMPALEGTWTINKIVDQCVRQSKSFYRINWDISACDEGTDDKDTWEPAHRIINEENDNPELLTDYLDRCEYFDY